MENVFQEGDVVYHPVHGEVPVIRATGDSVCAKLKNGNLLSTDKSYLSFSPWPEPNHIRPEPPIKEGWWLMHIKEDTVPLVRYVSGKSVYSTETNARAAGVVSSYVFIRYLGQDWKKEES